MERRASASRHAQLDLLVQLGPDRIARELVTLERDKETGQESALADEPLLQARFEQWKREHPDRLADPQAVLGFIFAHGQRHAEPEWRRYPIAGLLSD